MRVIKRTEGHFEAKKMEFGEVHRWCPERLVIQCDCGERPTLTSSVSTCGGCGTDHMIIFRDESIPRSLRDEIYRDNSSSHLE